MPSKGVFPDQGFQRQIDCESRSGNHQWSPSHRISENDQFCGTHIQPGLFHFATMINPSEDDLLMRMQHGLQTLQGFRNRQRLLRWIKPLSGDEAIKNFR